MSVDLNAEALRTLLKGPLTASEIASRVGWAPRSAGARMNALERHKLVVRKTVAAEDQKPQLVWALTERGATIAKAKSSDASSPPLLPPPAADVEAAAQNSEGAAEPTKDDGTVGDVGGSTDAAANDEGPWPSLRQREGGVDPVTTAGLSLTGWLFVLRAAHSGASDRSPADRRVIETHLKTLEDQMGWRWMGGRYENASGEVVSVHKLDYLKRLDAGG
jgi:hypothetical protein